MRSAIDFYFDFSSPYAYLAACRIDELAAAHGRTVNWRPVLIAALTQSTGTPLAVTVPVKWDYFRLDLPRVAEAAGIPFRFPAGFPKLMLEPGRAMLWIQETHGAATAARFARTCFQAYFGDGIDLADADVVAGIGAALGVDRAALLEGMASSAIKQQFKQASQQAAAQGVFGVPFMVVDGEPFWGFDRLPLLERKLASAVLR